MRFDIKMLQQIMKGKYAPTGNYHPDSACHPYTLAASAPVLGSASSCLNDANHFDSHCGGRLSLADDYFVHIDGVAGAERAKQAAFVFRTQAPCFGSDICTACHCDGFTHPFTRPLAASLERTIPGGHTHLRVNRRRA